MDEPQKHAKWKEPGTKGHLNEMPRINKTDRKWKSDQLELGRVTKSTGMQAIHQILLPHLTAKIPGVHHCTQFNYGTPSTFSPQYWGLKWGPGEQALYH